ncbi:MAG: alpha/beta fold hydrolase [bacterium]
MAVESSFYRKKMNVLLVCVLAVWTVGCSTAAKKQESTIIQPSGSLPVTTPWDLAALSVAPKFDWADERTGIRSLFYESVPFHGKPTRVFAYYATPGTLAGDTSKDKNLPGIVLVHGGGGKAFSEWAELWAKRGYAAIAMDLAGCGPDGERLVDGGPDQSDKTKFGAIDLPVTEQWTYHAVSNVILAHSLIRSLEEVNPSRTAITGISWGGYLTCIVAGLDNRFQAAVPVYGCGFLHDNSVWLDRLNNKMTPEQRDKWVRLWDPSMYVGSAEMPMLLVNGGKDFAYPPDSYAKTYSLVKGTKNIRFTPELPHGHIFDRPMEIEIFIEDILKSGTPLPKIVSLKIAEEEIRAKIKSKTKLIGAHLCYTTDDLSCNPKDRTWNTLPAQVMGKRVTVQPPPSDTTIWFINVVDERKAVVSSELIFPGRLSSR